MINVDGKSYPTIGEAARNFGVQPKTVRDWIERDILPDPPEVEYGLRTVKVFPPEYMKLARTKLDEHRKKRSIARSGTGHQAK